MSFPSKVIVVGAAWYGDWAKLFYKALLRLGVNAKIVYNNSLPAPVGGNSDTVTSLFEKSKLIFRMVSPTFFVALKKVRQRLSDYETLLRVGRGHRKIVVIFTWTPGSSWILEKLKKRGAILVLWQGEPTVRDATWEPKFDYFDHIFIIDDGVWVDILSDKNKKRVRLLPLSADETLFYPQPDVNEKYISDVVFIGKYYAHKAKSLERVKDYDLKIYGYGWEAGFDEFPWLKDKYFGPLSTEELNSVYNGAKLAIGTMGTPNDRFTTATMRTFDIALTGTFQICEESYLAKKLFGDTIGFFKSDEDIKDLVGYYLSHDKERKELASRSREIAVGYTYTEAAKKILATCV